MDEATRQIILSVTANGNSKFTPERQRIIVEAIRRGASIRLAASAAAISENVIRRWIREGDADNDNDDNDAIITDKGQFAIAVHLAEYDFAQRHLGNIEVNSIADWRASAWLLERRHPTEYGRQIALSGQVETPVVVSPERLHNIFEQMAAYEREQLEGDLGEVPTGSDRGRTP